jgi:phosphocarrier protein
VTEQEAALALVGAKLSRELTIVNMKGLHARATAKFVQCCDRFDAIVTVTKDDETVGGSSIMGILTLGAAKGSSILVTASGPRKPCSTRWRNWSPTDSAKRNRRRAPSASTPAKWDVAP